MADRQPNLDRQAYNMGRGIGETLKGPVLTSDEKYLDFLAETEFHNDRFEKKMVKEQNYYAEMSRQERAEHLDHIEFANMANFKKTTPNAIPNLETLSNGPEIKGLSTPENATIYHVPGVRTAIELYVRFYEHDSVLGQRDVRDPNKADITLKNSQGRIELGQCRKRVRDMLKNDVKNGYETRGQNDLSDEDLELKTRLAEQMAFTYLNAGNYFEGGDSEYNEVGRVREPGCFNEDMLNVAIKIAMNPLDQLINTFKKNYSDLTPYGKLGLWGYNQALISNGNRPLVGLKEIIFVNDENRDKNNFWKVTNNGTSITVPECYLRKTVGSVFEETKVDGRTLLDFIRNGEEIPWERVPGNMWSDYSVKLGKAQKIVELYQGKNNIQLGDEQKSLEWISLVNDTLSKFSLRAATQTKRWLFYSSVGIQENIRYPKIKSQRDKRGYNLDLVEGGYLNSKDLFFPWDKP